MSNNRTFASLKKSSLMDKRKMKEKLPPEIRLNRYIAGSGLCSRREADEFITRGFISVNGKTITDLGTKVSTRDNVKYKGRKLQPEKKVYLLINKPAGYVTTTKDPHAERTVSDLVRHACPERIYPVGRLDKDSTGVLLMTNDGDLTKKLTHPKYERKKIYHVHLNKAVIRSDLFRIVEGISVDGSIVRVDSVEYADPDDRKQVGIELHSGQNRVVRKIFESLGYRVSKLDRVYFAGLTKKNLPRGKWRFLTQKEITMLKRGIY
ncbi:MAG: rRNA pseudouridine synthase [Bacteroidales bacterium]|nr:rRNA pseudouridine synthase [Bacteroidales bacterium]